MGMIEQASQLARPLLRSRLFRSTGTLVVYTASGYAVTIAAGPVLSRLFSPIEFGLYGTFMAFVQASIVFSALNFDTAAPAPSSDKEAINVSVGAAAIASVVSALVTLGYLGLIWSNGFGYGSLPAWSALLCYLVVLSSSFMSAAQFWCLRRARFHAIGIGALITNVGRAALQIVLFMVGIGWVALAMGELAGRVLTLASYLFASRRDLDDLTGAVSYSRILSALKKNRRFATVLLPPMVADAILLAVTLPAITGFFGLAATGQYYLMKRLVDLPATLVSRTVSDAFYSRISELARTSADQVRPLLLRTFCLISGVSAIVLLPLLLFGPTLFAFVFGEPWRQAGLLSAIMVPGVVVSLGAAPVARVFAVTRLPSLRYLFTIANVIGTLSALGAAWMWQLGLVATVAGLAIAQFVAYSIYFVSAYLAAGKLQADVH